MPCIGMIQWKIHKKPLRHNGFIDKTCTFHRIISRF